MSNRFSIFRPTILALAASMCLFSNISHAQSNTTGNIFGQVQVSSGASVLLENKATGFKRTLLPDSTGRFQASALPTGQYRATLMVGGKAVSVTENVEVLLGQGSEVVFNVAASQTVQVTGKVARLDVSSSNNGATFTAKELAALPVAPTVDGIIQLAPNTTRTDSRYSGGASFGGGAASENSFYINGYPITNPLTQLGSSELPFGAIAQAQIQTGGFGVEFGRSIGGVVNIISKSGSNNWEIGVAATYTPNSLRADKRNIYWPQTGANPATDGKLFQARSYDEVNAYTLGASVGGPIIKDKLFIYAAVEKQIRDSGLVVGLGGQGSLESNSARAGWSDRKDTTNRYLTKLDWNVTDNHVLEATFIGDRYARDETLSGFGYTNFQRNGVADSSQGYTNSPDNNLGVGATTQILKYTGYLTSDLTVQVLTGRSRTPHPQKLVGYNPSYPQITIESNGEYPGITYPSLQSVSGNIGDPSYYEQTKATRFDLEYRLGKHTIRAGIDRVRLASLNAGEAYAGGRILTYSATEDATFKDNGMTQEIGTFGSVLRSGGFYYYGTESRFSNINNAYSNQQAQYIEDRYQATKNLLLTFGLRNEQYQNLTADGQSFLKLKDQITPRFAFAWDADGVGSTKVFGSIGRYAVQLPTSIALRGANASTLTDQVFSYTGVDAQGNPTGRVNLGPVFSSNNEYGQPKDLKSVSALNLKPNMQDELAIGIEKALSNGLNVGARFTYRTLVSSLDDYCDPRQLMKWANDRGITDKNGDSFQFFDDGHTNLPFSCATFNPGRANTFLIDYKQDGKSSRVELTADQLGFAKAKRTYMALDFFAEHPLKDGWYGKVAYTFSKNKGNTEGQTNSDLGQGDIAATVAWDHPELAIGAYGYLPNDRRHQIKAYGFLQLTPELQVGANALLASGRPKTCLGVPSNLGDEFDSYIFYGSVYHYCNGAISNRGSLGNLPWDKRLDMNVVYKPNFAKGLTLRADIFNVLNSQAVESVLERYENNNGSKRNSWGRVLSYTAPTSVKLTVAYDYKF